MESPENIQKVNWQCVANLTEKDFTQVENQSTGIDIIDKLAKQLTNFSQQSVMRYGLKLAFSQNPNQKYFISGGNQVIKRWQINTWEKLQEIPVTDSFDLWFTSVAISPNGKLIAACKNYQVYIWNVGEVKTIHTLSKTIFSNILDASGFDSVAFSPDSKVLAANDNQDIKLWDLETGKEITKLSGHSDKVTCVAFNPKDGRILASCSYDKTIKIWDLNSKKCLKTFSAHRDAVYTLAFSPDGKIIASGSNDCTIKLWYFDAAEMPKTLQEHSDAVTCLVFSLDANTLISGGNDGKIVEWKINDKKSQTFPEQHRRGVTSIAISLDGRTLISGGREQTIKVWKPLSRTILVLASEPTDKQRLRLGKEVQEIDQGLQRSQHQDKFTLKQKFAVRPDDLRRGLLDFNPQIVHFCGHGAGEDGLILQDDAGFAKVVSTQALADLFKQFATRGLECVVLNACYAEFQANVIAEHIDYVVGMNGAITDDAAIKFAIGFYDALGAGWSYEDAYHAGCSAIKLEGIPQEHIPVFKNRKQKSN